MNMNAIIRDLLHAIRNLHFGPPVSHVYNPLDYARRPFDQYWRRFGKSPKAVVFVGMNPGPWGMAQTGIPFGEIQAVKAWMGIQAPVDVPPVIHPKKPILGFSCKRSEVSGKRLWGWARERFKTPERFFSRFLVVNYCPLLFIEESGRNRTPDRLPLKEKQPLFDACDRALRRTMEQLEPQYVIGVGTFAKARAVKALTGMNVTIGRITHPSPANPSANRGWASLIEKELSNMLGSALLI